MTKYIIIIIVLIIVFILLYLINNYCKIKELSNNIDISLDKIKELLVKKKELLEKIIPDTKKKELKVAIKIDDNINIYELENVLFDLKWKLNTLIKDNQYKPLKEYADYMNELNDIEEDIEGLKDYCNNKVLNYNEKYLKKPFTSIYKLLKLESKKSFKLRHIDNFEILKD